MLNSIQSEEKAANRIEDLLNKIKPYLNPEKYTFDYAKVEQLFTEAVRTVEQTAQGVRPVDLPTDIPFSDSLDENGRSDPLSYAGNMSPKEYDKLAENSGKDKENTNDLSKAFTDDDPRIITVYQSPDRRHCALRQIENNGEFNDTDMPGRRYFLPDGFHVRCNYGHLCGILDSKGQDAYLIDSDSGYPYLHTSDSKTGHISQSGIPLRAYSEKPFELWNEYNTMLNAIDFDYRHGRTGVDHNGPLRLAITDCNKIMDNLYKEYTQNPGDKGIRDELAAKYEQRKWLEKEAGSPSQTEQHVLSDPESGQKISSSMEGPQDCGENEPFYEETSEQGMTL